MFENLTERLGGTFRKLAGKSVLTENNIQDALAEVRRALLEADVALSVVKQLMARVSDRAVGQKVARSLTPDQAFIKIVQAELQTLMGSANTELNLKTTPPAVILVAGLQGAGKTTTVAKLSHWLKQDRKKSVMVVSVDVYRPAAIQQLQTLAKDVGVAFFAGEGSQTPSAIAHAALAEARKKFVDVLLVDTAGRLAIDSEMMDEIRRLHSQLTPIETLFVVDAMTGQDAAVTAKAFHEALPLTGVVLTKADGDARGGAALSVRHVTGKPIKFLGVGEKPEALEPFHPDRIASRILGMGDMLTLVEEIERKADRQQSEKLVHKIRRGGAVNLEDYRQQLQQLNDLGGFANTLDKLPGVSALPPGMARKKVEGMNLDRSKVIIDSMTMRERVNPGILNGSRKRRITRGSGTSIQDLNRMLKQFRSFQKSSKAMKRMKVPSELRGLKGQRGR